ncbi:HK97 family phage portal protein [Methylobacterium fujisawaense]|uniref:HK97 family phage portal protein n=1 Tax=Methylobacterium fujisawaense TaxID=107400 RepID=A0ABR6D6I0_9HYPH|nr:phage portal protein [Methylobacterium fujisawaense]MBA9061695.1 HK97 family phage portal protein [Methylobacterium fujisawaense]
MRDGAAQVRATGCWPALTPRRSGVGAPAPGARGPAPPPGAGPAARWETKAAPLRADDAKAARIWGRLFGYADAAAGKPVTPDTALQVSAFWACVKLLAETIATLPLALYRREADGGRSPAPDHPLSLLLRVSPDGEHTAVEFWEGAVLSLCLHGDAFAEKIRAGGRLIALQPLQADRVTVRRDPDGALVYDYADPLGVRSLGEADVFHLRAFGSDGLRGLSPLKFARQTVSAALAADEVSNKLFANGVRPSGVLQMDQVLKPEQRKDLRENVVAPLAGSSNAGGVFVLEAGMKFSAVSLSPADSQLLESRRWHVEEICRWFGIPPILIGHASEGQTMWGTGVEQIALSWLALGLRAQLRRIEAAIHLRLIEPAERATLYAEFAVEGLLRADSAARAKLYASFAQNGIMDRDEIREKENLDRRGGGAAKLTVQANLLPIDDLGTVAVMRRERPVAPSAETVPPDGNRAGGGGPTGRGPFDREALFGALDGAHAGLKAFDPAKHPRDADGRFAGAGGGGRAAKRLATRALADRSHRDVLDLGRVHGARFSAHAGQDVDGWRHGVTAEFVRHIDRRHGPGSGEANPITPSDYRNLPRLLRKGTVTRGGKTRGQALQGVVVRHTIRGQTYEAVLAVRKRSRSLTLHTFYKIGGRGGAAR